MSLSLNTCLFERRGFILLDRDIVSTGVIVKSKRRMEKVLGHLVVVMVTVLHYSEALVLVLVIVICFGGLVYCGW